LNIYKIRNHGKFNETEMQALYLLGPGQPIPRENRTGNQKKKLLGKKN